MAAFTLTSALLLLTLTLASHVQGAIYVDLCNDFSGSDKCCYGPEGEQSQYWIMPMTDVASNKVSCISDSIGATDFRTRLVHIETQAENDCLTKYILKQYAPTSVEQYVIGLESTDYPGVWEWQNTISAAGETTTAGYQHWLFTSTMTSGSNCAVMNVGVDNPASGFWSSINCNTGEAMAICEKQSTAEPGTKKLPETGTGTGN